jgi:hypothetical protein
MTNSQGWVFPHEGARNASSSISCKITRGTGSGLKALMLFLERIASTKSILIHSFAFNDTTGRAMDVSMCIPIPI